MVAEAVPEVVDKKPKKKAESVWLEDVEQHRLRLSAKYHAAQGLQYPDKARDEIGKRLQDYYRVNIEKARKCLEFQAYRQYDTYTRLRGWQDWEKAAIPSDDEDFYQDARLLLMVKFDETLRKFVPLTDAEFATEAMDAAHRHAQYEMQKQFRGANQSASDAIDKWAKFKPCNEHGPTLYRRGDYASFFKKSAAGNDLYRRAKEDWELGKATLLQSPRFEAVQVVENKSAVRVTMYDGDNALETWVDNDPPYRSELIHPRMAANAEKFAIGFLPCPPELYAAYLGQKYIKPGSAEEYAWEDALPNPACEFTVDAAEFVAAMKHGVVVASGDMTRPILCSLFLTNRGEGLSVVSTDTYRLLVQDVSSVDIPADIPNIMLPMASCNFIAKAMKHPVGQIRLRYGRTVENGDVDVVEITGETMEKKQAKPVQFVTRTMYGQFVNYTKVVPNSHEHCIAIDPETTVQRLKEMLRVACNDNNRVILRNQAFVDGQNSLRLEANNDGEYLVVKEADNKTYFTGKQHMEMPLPIERIEGCPEEFAFNAEYAIDYLSWQDGPVNWEINGPLNSFAFRNGRTMMIQMPMSSTR